jgi:hypothetical protein
MGEGVALKTGVQNMGDLEQEGKVLFVQQVCL